MLVRRIGIIGRTYRHINRYRQIVSVLLRHGFSDTVARLGLHRHPGLGLRFLAKQEAQPEPVPLTRSERIRMVLEELGPSFVKLGQVMSTRPDMVSPELRLELEKLQDTVPPFPAEEARRIVEAELGDSIGAIFKEFDETPVASASMAQVYRAVLADGETVAVKTQRPGIKQAVEVDLEIMLHLAALMAKHLAGMDVIDPVGIIGEFARSIRKEMDFSVEAAHIERFARNFESDPSIRVPRVLRHLVTDKILTMEFMDGTKVSELTTLSRKGLAPQLIADRGAELILKQVFDYGFFHADPHPGNILVLEDNVICFLDYGMMGRLTGRHRECLGRLVVGVVRRDERAIARALLDLSVSEEPKSIDGLEVDVADFVEQHLYRPLSKLRVGTILNQFVELLVRHQLKMPPDFYLLIKALVTVEGNGRKLAPDFDMIRHMEPFATKLVKEKMSPRKLVRDMYLSAHGLAALLRDLPSDTREILALMKRGKARLEFEHKGLEPMLKTHDQISNRIVFAIVLASLVIGSALIVLSDIPPKWWGIPVIGIVGFVAAGLMGFWLLVSIVRHGNM